MGLTVQLLASGEGWGVSDVVCDSGPHERPFEEQHQSMCIAAVTEGTFLYRSTRGSALLAPGAVLLGNERDDFECGHDHSRGDRCLAFHFSPGFLEDITAEISGVHAPTFRLPRLPPLESMTPLLAAAEAARDAKDAGQLEELAVRIAASVTVTLRGVTESSRTPTASDARRVSEVLRWMEPRLADPFSLGGLSREAAMSPYHFVRTFRKVVGVTPYEYVLQMRLQRVCVELRRSSEPISTIAFRAGFSDLSTFNRQFRRMVKETPSTYRTRA